ncbi:MAG TPA: hypothetical protein VL326_01765 [Kofleriaceae bacterium]|jgi:hypothetical protein|nr:hypothetical protein [Kofleriaceae bacterium]
MARWTLERGERVISTHSVQLVDGRGRLPATIFLTNHRLVVTAGTKTSGWGWFLAGPIALMFEALRNRHGSRIYYQMKRERFVSVEPGEGRMLVFHDDGEGYAHVSFAITPDLLISEPESLQTWQTRMHAWSSGTAEAATLPTATVIDS